ncbi:MAG: peptide deformylase, partial [Peptostreptococcaceae bacterium]
MAIRQIVQIGEPVLRKKSKVVEKIDEKIIQLLDDMADTMYHADGVGLAAPQVGILKRVVVIDIGDGIIELINPEIIETSGEQIDDEGCLSVIGE